MPGTTLHRVDLDHEPDHTALLSPDERVRAAQLRHPNDRRRFVACRGALRLLLAARLGLAPDALRFTYGPHGKPTLEGEGTQADPLHFNLAHADGLGLIALSDRPVGVDLERIRPDTDLLALSREVFTPTEQAALAALSGVAQQRAFFTCWTRKEALVKCDGAGLSSVWRTRTVWPQPEAAVTTHFTLIEYAIGSDYVAAVCGVA